MKQLLVRSKCLLTNIVTDLSLVTASAAAKITTFLSFYVI